MRYETTPTRTPHIEGANVNDLINDTREASNKIKSLTGKAPTLYRAPYGEYDNSLITTIEGMGMKVIQWDVGALDTDGKFPVTLNVERYGE